jgi:hypothetical protein
MREPHAWQLPGCTVSLHDHLGYAGESGYKLRSTFFSSIVLFGRVQRIAHSSPVPAIVLLVLFTC